MTEQEQFEADYTAAFWVDLTDGLCKNDDGAYISRDTVEMWAVWRQQAKRHKSEIAELNEAIRKIPELVQASLAFAEKRPSDYVLVPKHLPERSPIRDVLVDRFYRSSKSECLLFSDIWRDLISAAEQEKQS